MPIARAIAEQNEHPDTDLKIVGLLNFYFIHKEGMIGVNTITFDNSKPFDIVCSGRIAVDFNPVDLNQPLEDCTTFKKYLGGSPANIRRVSSAISSSVFNIVMTWQRHNGCHPENLKSLG